MKLNALAAFALALYRNMKLYFTRRHIEHNSYN